MPEFENKICTREELKQRVAALPKPVVLTNGVFDILHRGHVTYLAQARALGASLVVAANTDASVKRLGKGDDRPLNTCADRMAVLAALESVSLVVDFDEDTALEVVQEAQPGHLRQGRRLRHGPRSPKGRRCWPTAARRSRSISSTTARPPSC